MSTLEQPKTYVVWNSQLAALTTEGNSSRSCSYLYETSGSDFSSSTLSDSQILSMWDPSQEDSSLELTCSELRPKEPLYNIIRSTMNLAEKRGPKFFCPECRHPLHTRLSMVTHMKMHRQPFCEVCFQVFESPEVVHSHILISHPEVIIRDGSTEDFLSLQTAAPPNTPTLLSDDEMKAIEELTHPIMVKSTPPLSLQVAISSAVAEKEETDGGITTEDELRLVIDDGARPGPSSKGRPAKKSQPPAVKRTLKKKKAPKKVKVDDSLPENVMKKITSRFGRSISLKVPQF